MYFSDAILQEIDARDKQLLTEYDFYVLAYDAYQKHKTGQIKVRNPPRSFDSSITRRTIRQLERRRLIVRDPDFRGAVWQALKSPPVVTAEEAICLIDPFARIAYLSAFERYGLTDRSPKSLQILTYGSPQWGQKRRELMQQDLPEAMLYEHIASPNRVHNRSVVRRRPIDIFHTKRIGPTKKVRGTAARISTIGQTYLDSLEQPELCGGMRHVIKIWKASTKAHVNEIVDSIEERGSPINKVRAGFLLENFKKTSDPIVSSWEQFAQRGGSRKLDPNAPYKNQFSEKWMLSLNV